MTKKSGYFIGILLISVIHTGCTPEEPVGEDQWISLFNGTDLTGWTASENPETFSVEDGLIVANGERSHLFYTGDVAEAEFSNFELKAEVMTTPGSNSGIYFHTKYQEEGWPAVGYEAQVNNSHIGEGDYRELKKTGSLYGIRNTYKQLVPDNEWFDYHISVSGRHIQTSINGILVVDYWQQEPVDSVDKASYPGMGTFALQGHDPHSKVLYRNIMVKIIEDPVEDRRNPVTEDSTYLKMRELMGEQHSFTDMSVELDENLDLDACLEFYYRTGINIGVLLDSNEYDQIEMLKTHPVFIGAGEKINNSEFDYVIGPAGSYPEGLSGDAFMEAYIDSIIDDLEQKGLDVWSGATNLPEGLEEQRNLLWTESRMNRVIEAAVANEVAIEIDNHARLPGLDFINLAGEKGAKFTYAHLGVPDGMGEMDYIFQVIEHCKLEYKDVFIP